MICAYQLINIIQPGNMIGELGLLYRRQRQASCIALTDCSLAEMSAKDFYRSFNEIEKHKERIKTVFFEKFVIRDKQISFLSSFFALMFERRSVHKGEILVEEGNTSNTFWILYSGEVSFSKLWRAKKTSLNAEIPFYKNFTAINCEHLVILEKGEMISEESIFDENYIYPYRAQTLCRSVFYVIPAKKLWVVFREHREIELLMRNRLDLKKLLIDKILHTFEITRQNKSRISANSFASSYFLNKTLNKSNKEEKATHLKSILFSPPENIISVKKSPKKPLNKESIYSLDFLKHSPTKNKIVNIKEKLEHTPYNVMKTLKKTKKYKELKRLLKESKSFYVDVLNEPLNFLKTLEKTQYLGLSLHKSRRDPILLDERNKSKNDVRRVKSTGKLSINMLSAHKPKIDFIISPNKQNEYFLKQKDRFSKKLVYASCIKGRTKSINFKKL